MDTKDTEVPLLGSILAVGLTWIFLPAFTAAIADNVDWESKVVGEMPRDGAPPLLSIVIPAFDEEKRLPKMLLESHKFLGTDSGLALLRRLRDCSNHIYSNSDARHIEWIVVNDGSRDNTVRAAESTMLSMGSSHQWRFLTLSSNSGKGAAVKTGMVQANGVFRLMVDADGATSFGSGFENLVGALECELLSEQDHPRHDMLAVFGSRAHLQKDASTQRSLVRSMLMHAFHFFVGILVSSRLKDTQCGFKLFTQTSASRIFSTLHLHRWAFDTEVVLICEEASIKILEVDVPWREIEGSKLNTSKFALAVNSLCMLRDIICVRLCYMVGLWKITKEKDS